jgi:hypothetical protein
MPAYWQITKLRAEQTMAVWALNEEFVVGAKSFDNLSDLLDACVPLIDALATAETNFSTALTARQERLALLQMIVVKGAGKMSADLEDDDELDVALGQKVFSIDANGSEADLIKRCRAFLPIWTLYNARPEPVADFTVRGKTIADFTAALTAYETDVDLENTRSTALSTARTGLEQHNRIVDRLIKKWYAAWKNEYPAGTPEGDALLSQVDAEEGQQRPTKLEIAALTMTDPTHVGVAFAAGGGARATLRLLQIKVVGVDADFRTVRELSVADVTTVVTVGPFAAGQQVLVRTDVGNSRDPSELSAVQSIVVP